MAHASLTYNAVLVKREDYTDEHAVFHIRHNEPLVAPDGGRLFVPGQYVALGLNDESPEQCGVRRSMSLASAPEEGATLQFYIRLVEEPTSGYAFTHLLWKRKVGDPIFMTRKPVGKFTLEHTMGDVPRKKTLMVAAGTGLAPFVSMVRSRKLRDPAADMSDLVLLHGASYANSLVFREELEGYAATNGLHYYPTVSRPQQSPGWTGSTGRVESFFEPEKFKTLEGHLGETIKPATTGILICGLQGTIAGTLKRLMPKGFVPFDRKLRKGFSVPDDAGADIWWEQYDSEPVLDLSDTEMVSSIREQMLAALG